MTTTTDERPSASDFRDPLLRTLGDLTNHKANRPVKFKDTLDPICNSMGITLDKYGPYKKSNTTWVEKWIQWAFRKLRKDGLGVAAGRGQWALTSQGVQVSLNLATTVTPAAEPVKADTKTKKAKVAEVVPIQGVSLPIGPGSPEDAYHPDPFIRALAVQNTNCFSNYTTKGGSLCERCPLQGACKNAMAAKLSTLARKMAAEDEEAKRKAAEEKARAKMQAAKATSPSPAPSTPAPEPTTKKVGGGEAQWGPGHEITIQQQSLCKACGKEIEQGTKAIWVRSNQGGSDNAGVFHPKCYKG